MNSSNNLNFNKIIAGALVLIFLIISALYIRNNESLKMMLSNISPSINSEVGGASVSRTNSIAVGDLVSDGPATPEQISLYIPVTGSVSQGTSATVRYKRSGSSNWVTGHPLLRIQPGYTDNGQPDGFAWPIIDLTPGTSYDVEVTLTNESGSDVRTLTTTTRSLPSAAGPANKIIPTGASSTYIQNVLSDAVPGDVIEFKNGTYNIDNIFIVKSGTESQPIYIRGESRDGVILSDATGNILQIQDVDNVIIENMTLKGSGVDTGIGAWSNGILFWKNDGNNNQTRITVRNLNIKDVDVGIKAFAAITSFMAYDNTLSGNNRWDQDVYGQDGGPTPGAGDGTWDIDQNTMWNDDGICMPGYGNVAFNNTLSGFGDAFAFSVGYNDPSVGNHFYRNDVKFTGDDLLEADYSTRNLTFYDNRSNNSMTALSLDPLFGGPLVYARNVVINPGRTPFKWNNKNSGQFILNNTIVETARDGNDISGWYQPNNGDQENYGFQNNVFIYKGTKNLTPWIRSGGQALLDFTNNSWYPDRGLQWWSDSWPNLAAAQASQATIMSVTPIFSGATKRHANDNIISADPFTISIPLGPTHHTFISGAYIPRLKSDSPAKNSGVAIPNINDGYTGSAPDRGAIIDGLTLPTWGDRGTPPGIIPAQTPTVIITANPQSITQGNSTTITWSSTNSTSCTASGAWSGTKSTSGTQSVSPTATSTYSLSCSGVGGSANSSVTVSVNSTQVVVTGYGALGTAVSNMSQGEWLDWTDSTNVKPITDIHPVDGTALGWLESTPSYYLTNWPGKATWDDVSKQIIVSGSAQSLSSEVPAGTHHSNVFLNVATGKFSKQWNPMNANIGHIYDSNVSSFSSNGYIYRRSWTEGAFWKMDRSKVWSPVNESPQLGNFLQGALDVPAIDFYPSLGAQGSILLITKNGKIVRYDIQSNTASVATTSLPGVSGLYPVMAYHSSINSAVFGGGENGKSIYKMNSNGVISLITNSLPAGILGIGPDGDSSNSVLLPDALGNPYAWLFDFGYTKKIWRLDLNNGSWGEMGSLPAATAPGAIATIPQLGVYVLLQGGGRLTPTISNSKVWIYKPNTVSNPTPTVTITANPQSITQGNSTTITWSSTNSTSCTASGAWSGTKSTSGTQSVSPTATSTYSLSCSGANGSATASTVVAISLPVAIPLPTVTISASPSSIAYNGKSTISWSSTNANSCSYVSDVYTSAAKSSAKSNAVSAAIEISTSGSFQTPSLTVNTSYTITCTGAGGSKDAIVIVNVAAAPVVTPAPTVTITATPSSIAYNTKSTINWSSTNASSCTSSWASAPISTTGTYTTPNLTTNTTYTVTCTGQGGSKAASVIVNVGAAPIPDPTVTITATPTSITYNTKSTISWSSTNANSCTNSWSNTTGTSGTYTTPNLTTNTTYTVTCTNAGGSKAASVIVNVGANPIPDPTPLPTITLTATPTSIAYNTKSTLTWSTTNAASCTSTWGNVGTEGSYTTPNLTTNTTYTLTCKNTANETKSSSVIINVASAPTPDPTVTISASPSSIAYNGKSTISWSSTNASSCTSSWSSSPLSTQGSYTTPNLTTNTTYTITCNGDGGSKAASVIVNVGAAPTNTPAPVVNITATPSSTDYLSKSTITWTSTNANSCSSSWANTVSTSGSYATPQLSSNTVYTVICNGEGGTQESSVVVNVKGDRVGTPLPPTSLPYSSPSPTPYTQQPTSVTSNNTEVKPKYNPINLKEKVLQISGISSPISLTGSKDPNAMFNDTATTNTDTQSAPISFFEKIKNIFRSLFGR